MSFITPELNTTLNAISAVLLCCAYVLIKTGRWRAHGYTMVSAVLVSTAFLACYLIYHLTQGEKRSNPHADPLLRYFYFAVLFPHLILAVSMIPMIGITLWRAYKRDWVRHRRIAKPTFFIWLYVSVTGVLVYFLLYHTSLNG